MQDTTKALRYNSGKPDYTLLDFRSLIPMVDVLEYGKTKYTTYDDDGNKIDGRCNWKKQMDPKEALQSLVRHVAALSDGEELDPESGLPHIGHIMCNAQFYIYHSKLEYDRTNIQNRALSSIQSVKRAGDV